MGLLDGYVGGRFAKGKQPDYSSIESKLDAGHLIAKTDSNLTLDAYIEAVSKGQSLHSELANVKSMIKYKLNELKDTNKTKEAYESALEDLIIKSKNVVVGKSFKRSNAHERPWLFKSHVGIDVIDENAVANSLNVKVEGAGIVYAGSHSRFDLYKTSSKELLRGVLDDYLFHKTNKNSKKSETGESAKHAANGKSSELKAEKSKAKDIAAHALTKEDVDLSTSLQRKYDSFLDSLTDEEKKHLASRVSA